MKRIAISLITSVALLVFCWAAQSRLASQAQDSRGVGISKQGRRIALVIGNGAYDSAPLANPANDARGMAEALRRLGFDVIELTNQTKSQMRQALRAFGDKLESGEGNVALFFFAGHGAQVNGRNYLIPIGVDVTNEAEAEDECVNIDLALAQMKRSRNGLNIVILDACRNNPFRGWRSPEGGLAFVNAPRGTLIAYATAPGRTAADGRGKNSPYTSALLNHIGKPDINLLKLFENVRAEVERATNYNQTPWESTSVTNGSEFYLAGKEERPVQPFDPRAMELEYWNSVKNSSNPADLRAYLIKYPNGEFKHLAENRLREMDKGSNHPTGPNAPAPRPNLPTSVTSLPRGVDPARLTIHNFTTATVDAAGKVSKFAGAPMQQYSEDLGNGAKLEMVAVKGGTFTMGSVRGDADETPTHTVTVGDFWIGKFEVTQKQWKAVMGNSNNPSRFKGDDLPVEGVTWEKAKEFCRRLNTKLGLSETDGYRLPSEAEWEYAARGGSKTEFAFGETINLEIVNYNENYPYGSAAKIGYRQVGSLNVANAWGLFDMHGNVWEWCEDDWHNSYNGAPTDGRAWVDTLSRASSRVTRGGSCFHSAEYCRSANRSDYSPIGRFNAQGFRLSRSAQ